MQIPQTTYNDLHVALKNGQQSESALNEKWSRIAKNAITLGTFCLLGDNGPAGASPGQCKAIPDATASLGGNTAVALYDAARSPLSTAIATASGSGQYVAGDDVPLLRKGECGMYSEAAWTQGNPVYVRTTAAGSNVNGQVRDGAAANFVLHPTAVFANNGTGAGVALVEVK
jgi:hypothetical protein